jgi:hypothetical protein
VSPVPDSAMSMTPEDTPKQGIPASKNRLDVDTSLHFFAEGG